MWTAQRHSIRASGLPSGEEAKAAIALILREFDAVLNEVNVD